MTQGTAGTFFTHIMGWVLFLLLPLLFISGQNSNIGIADIILSPFYWIFLLCYATFEAEKGKVQAELSYLKAQINRHFLFNKLNNIHALATTLHANTAPAIFKLPNILRYVTEETSDDLVPLEKEISCIKDYLDLQRLRVSNKTEIYFKIEGDPASHILPAMLLMTFIENAFKFGVSNHEESVIAIRVVARHVGSLYFNCKNSIFDSTATNEGTSIGLANTTQRLDRLYKDNYELQTTKNDGMFTLTLEFKGHKK